MEGIPEGEVDPALLAGMQFYESKDAEKGYSGRLGLYEVFRMDNELRKLISEGASTLQIETASKKNGMITLEQAGLIKALQGETTLSEVYRVARKSE